MNRGTVFFYVTLLVLVLLTQVLILEWAPDTVFFVTWLLLALTLHHDSRISAAVGLAFLGICPFLLVAQKGTVAEQAAQYAYGFLAIGVLVQLEDMLLEHYGWLGLKLNFTHTWQRANQRFQSRALAALQTLGWKKRSPARFRLVWWVQVAGTVALTGAFLWAVGVGMDSSRTLLLLGGAILFPVLVWGSRLAIPGVGPVVVSRITLVLVILPLAAAEMVWLYDLLTASRVARMKAVYDFTDYLSLAQSADPIPEGEMIDSRMWTIDQEPRRVLYQHPAFTGVSHLAYQIWIGRDYVMSFSVATAPESWSKEGDGVTFAVYVQTDKGAQQIFSTYIDPKHEPAHRRWHPYTIDLGDYHGQTVTITLETGAGPAGDSRFDWAGWGRPQLLVP